MALVSTLDASQVNGGQFTVTLKVQDGPSGAVGDRRYTARITWSSAYYKRCDFSPQTRYRGSSYVEWRDRTAPRDGSWDTELSVVLCCRKRSRRSRVNSRVTGTGTTPCRDDEACTGSVSRVSAVTCGCD